MTNYRITPVNHWSGAWAWWATRSFGYGGDTPTFYIATANHYNLVAGERLAVWGTAADSDNWNNFTTVTIGTPDLSFTHGTAFPAGMIYVAALPMYPFSRVQRKMNEWTQSAYVAETTSSTDYKIGTATARTVPDGSGRTAPALPYYGFKLTGDRVGNKNKAILTAGNHPSETPGFFSLEGAMDWLLGGSVEAETLLDYFEFYVYPCLNPQGVWSGWFRSSPQTAASDNNRIWDTTGTNEAVDAFKTAFTADTGGNVDVAIDYHSYMDNTGRFSTVYDSDGTYEQYFLTEMGILQPGYLLTENTLTTTIVYWWLNSIDAELAVFVENGGISTQGITHWKAHGENSMKAIYEMLVDGRFTYGT